ncbi:MAG: hypothetical protein GY828_03900 [Candidatus Gracilibacteria bacterium]|nr:hypothetical protein [Candidatus Gracilibacteria bacterium]
MNSECISRYKSILKISELNGIFGFNSAKKSIGANIQLYHGGIGVIFEKDGSEGYLKMFVNKVDIIMNKLNSTDFGYVIHLAVTKCNYGGYRWWFICPGSGKKCANLYLYKDGKFYSRKYLNLIYPEQLLSKNERIFNNGLWKYHNKAEEVQKSIKYTTRNGLKTRKQRKLEKIALKLSTKESRQSVIDERIKTLSKKYGKLGE